MRISAPAETLMAQSKATPSAIFAILVTPPLEIPPLPLVQVGQATIARTRAFRNKKPA